MDSFYQTFYKNPRAPWRYICGFEPTMMPQEDLDVYRDIQMQKSLLGFKPWVKKMTRADRLMITGSAESIRDLPELEWFYYTKGIWLGRLPQAQKMKKK